MAFFSCPIGPFHFITFAGVSSAEIALMLSKWDFRQIATEPIPTWALCYLINGDPTGLTDDEIAMIDKWYADNKVQTVTTASEAEGESNPYFSHFPAFGLPAEVTDCHVMTF